MDKKVPQMFRFGVDVAEHLDIEAISVTFTDMYELGLTRAPYEDFSILIETEFLRTVCQNSGAEDDFSDTLRAMGASLYIRYQVEYGETYEEDTFACLSGFQRSKNAPIEWVPQELLPPNVGKSMMGLAKYCYRILIVLLATPNVEKTVTRNTSHAASHKTRQDAKNFEYTTTIRIGKITEICSGQGSGTGSSKRPHLRRGHIRRQRHGEGRTEVKKIFIPPMFVNADENWIRNERKEYKILMANGAK